MHCRRATVSRSTSFGRYCSWTRTCSSRIAISRCKIDMPRLQEGNLTFDFPDGGPDVAKYDEWSFFRNQFQTVCGGVTAVDFIFVETGRTWLIEVKDYRHHRRTKVTDLAGEVATKVRDTLAGLAACRCNANDAMEQRIAERALSTRRLGIVLHLEQPATPSSLLPRAADPTDLTQKLNVIIGENGSSKSHLLKTAYALIAAGAAATATTKDIAYDIMSLMRVRTVLDTDVVVAAVRSDAGASRHLLVGALDKQYPLLVSVPLMVEYEAVLTRPEHLAATGLSADDVQSLLDAVATVAEPVRLSYLWRPTLTDPQDDMVMETALNGSADLLVTFNLRHFRQAAKTFAVQVLSPADALQRLEEQP